MPGPFWSEAQTDTLVRLRNAGKGWVEISNAIGKSTDALRKKWAALAANGPVGATEAPPTAESMEMENAALRARLARLEAKDGRRRQEVTAAADDDPEEDWESAWKKSEDDSARRIARAAKLTQLVTRFEEKKPVAVAFVSDQHVAPGTPVDFRRMREDAELIAATEGLYAVLGGDAVDNHIRILPAMLASRSQPEDQWHLFNYYLEIFADKVLAMVAGNHDLWTNQVAGVDVLRMIADRQKVRYSQSEAYLALDVAGVPYKIGVRHQYRMNSSFNQTHSVKQWMRLGEEEFDVGCVCHHHEASQESFLYRGKHRVAIRPGSYQVTSAYSAQYGWNRSVPLCPTVIFFPGERRLQAFFDVRDAAEALTWLRG